MTTTKKLTMMRVVECCHFLPEFLHSFPGFQSQLLTTPHYYSLPLTTAHCSLVPLQLTSVHCCSLVLLLFGNAAAHCSQGHCTELLTALQYTAHCHWTELLTKIALQACHSIAVLCTALGSLLLLTTTILIKYKKVSILHYTSCIVRLPNCHACPVASG